MAEPPAPDDHSPLPPMPRRTTSVERPADFTPKDALTNFADSVKVLADQLGQKPANPPEDEQDRASRRGNKFQRRVTAEPRRSATGPAGAPADGLQTASDELPVDDLPDEKPDADESATGTSLYRGAAWPRLQPGTRPPQNYAAIPSRQRAVTIPLLVLMACNLFMLVLGFWLGQSASSGDDQQVINPPPVPGINGKAMEKANAALAVEKSGDIKAAEQLYNDAVQNSVVLPGTEYRLAMLALQRKDQTAAEVHMVHSMNSGEFVAPILYLRAFAAGQKGDFAEASNDLEAATHAEPFTARYYFFEGETLRREGNPRAAINCLLQALNRAYSSEEGDLYIFKLGLAQIESGSGDDFNAALAEHLQQQPVPGDWLLLAAAQDMDRAAYPAAVEHLKAAEHVLPLATFNSRVRDYFFQTHAQQAEAAPYLNRPAPPEVTEAGPSIMDPGSWSAEKGDPGNWPVVAGTAH